MARRDPQGRLGEWLPGAIRHRAAVFRHMAALATNAQSRTDNLNTAARLERQAAEMEAEEAAGGFVDEKGAPL